MCVCVCVCVRARVCDGVVLTTTDWRRRKSCSLIKETGGVSSIDSHAYFSSVCACSERIRCGVG